MRFASSIYNYQLFPSAIIGMSAALVPWLEVLVGLALVTGVKIRGASLLVFLLVIVFISLAAISLVRGLDIECGCFSGISRKADWLAISEDLGLLVCTLFIFFFDSARITLVSLVKKKFCSTVKFMKERYDEIKIVFRVNHDNGGIINWTGQHYQLLYTPGTSKASDSNHHGVAGYSNHSGVTGYSNHPGAAVTQTTPKPLVTQTTPKPLVTQTTSEPLVTLSTTILTTGGISTIQQALLADIRSKAEQPAPGIYYVDAVTAKKLVDETHATFLDARYLVDYDKAHVSGAVSLPVSSVWKGSIDPKTVLPDTGAVYIAYCAPGCPAGLELAQELSIRGYHNLFVLSGGYLAWEDAGYPMVKQ